jgi:DNA-binding NarL/FixJ family response regulator
MLPHPHRIRALVADESPLAVHTICACLREDPAVTVVGTASNGPEAVSMIEDLRPNLVLLDLELPGMNGFEVAAQVAAKFPRMLVVVVTSTDVFKSIAKLSKLGVYGIVAKQDLREQLPQLLRRIIRLPRF